MADLATWVKRRAKDAGGLRALSRSTGIGIGYLSRLQNGLKANPSDEFLSRLGIQRHITYRATNQPAKGEGKDE